jgi:hypothetical protein
MTLTGVFVLQFYLPPLPSRKVPSLSLPGPSNRNRRMSLTRAEKEERDELGEQIERRREVYQHELYCKVSTVILSRSPAKCKTEASLEFVSLTCRDLFQHIASNTTSDSPADRRGSGTSPTRNRVSQAGTPGMVPRRRRVPHLVHPVLTESHRCPLRTVRSAPSRLPGDPQRARIPTCRRTLCARALLLHQEPVQGAREVGCGRSGE